MTGRIITPPTPRIGNRFVLIIIVVFVVVVVFRVLWFRLVVLTIAVAAFEGRNAGIVGRLSLDTQGYQIGWLAATAAPPTVVLLLRKGQGRVFRLASQRFFDKIKHHDNGFIGNIIVAVVAVVNGMIVEGVVHVMVVMVVIVVWLCAVFRMAVIVVVVVVVVATGRAAHGVLDTAEHFSGVTVDILSLVVNGATSTASAAAVV